jgi:hypothetical protein
MGTNELILLKAQAGIETVRGTNVAATRKIYAQITPTYTKPLQQFQDTTGTYFDRRRAAYGLEEIGFTGLDLATFEDLPWWAGFFLKGGVTGVSDAGTPNPAYSYLFAPSASTDNLKSMTLEFNEDGNPYESGQVMVTQATLRMNVGNNNEPAWMLDLTLMGRDWTTTTFTVALSDRDTEVILGRGTKLFIDDAGGTIGATQKLGSLISASVTFMTNIHFKNFGEDETTYAKNKVGRGAYQVDAQFQFEFDNDTEFAKYRNSTPQPRLIRLEREGTTIHTTVKKRMRLDFPRGIWNSWSRGDRQGNLVANFGMQAFYDVTEANIVELEIVNALATLA